MGKKTTSKIKIADQKQKVQRQFSVVSTDSMSPPKEKATQKTKK